MSIFCTVQCAYKARVKHIEHRMYKRCMRCIHAVTKHGKSCCKEETKYIISCILAGLFKFPHLPPPPPPKVAASSWRQALGSKPCSGMALHTSGAAQKPFSNLGVQKKRRILRTSGYYPRAPALLGSLTCKTECCAPPQRSAHLQAPICFSKLLKDYSRAAEEN
jgi:hypothetical protein